MTLQACRWALLLAMVGTLSAQSYTAVVQGSGYQAPPPIAVAPGQIATFFVGGLPQTTAGLAKLVAAINVAGSVQQIPVLSAKPFGAEILAITVQLPFAGLPSPSVDFFVIEQTPFSIQFAETDNPTGDLCAKGSCSAPFTMVVTETSPHLINMCDVFVNNPATNANCPVAVTHQNGTLATSAAPALVGETLTAWAVGLGTPSGGIPAGATGPIQMNDISIGFDFSVSTASSNGFTFVGTVQSPNPTYQWAGLPVPSQGLYQINFVVPAAPAGLTACTPSSGNFSVSIARRNATATWNYAIFAIGGGPICVVTK